MTPAPSPATADRLAPLVTALAERAQRDAAELLAQADADRDAVLARARQEAAAVLAQARADGEADAADVLARRSARAQREARGLLLAAARKAHDDARKAAREAVSALREEDVYPQLLAALRARARRELGPSAAIVELPRGGIEASSSDRRLEFSLEGLADDLLDGRAGELAELWSP